MSKVENSVNSPFWDAVGTTWESSEGLQKVLKPINGALKVVHKATGEFFAPLKVFMTQIGIYIGLIDGLNFINRTVDFACKNEKGKYFVDETIHKIMKQIFLGIGHTMEGIKFMEDSLGLFSLGKITGDVAFFAGSFCPWLIVKDVFITASAVFGIVDSAKNKLPNINERIKSYDLKLKKWTDRTGLDKTALANLYKEKVAGLTKRVEDDKQRANTELAKVELKHHMISAQPASKKQTNELKKSEQLINGLKKAIASKLEGPEARIKKWTEYAQAFENTYTDGMEQKITEKKAFWTKKVEVLKKNAPLEKAKAWMSIANDIGKIVIILVAMVGVLTGMILIPWYTYTVMGVAIVANSVGFAKFIHEKIVDKIIKNNPEPNKPIYTPVRPPLPAASAA